MRKFPQIKKLASWVTVLSSYSIWLRRDINLNGQSWQCRWPLKRPSRKYWRRIYFEFLILKSYYVFLLLPSVSLFSVHQHHRRNHHDHNHHNQLHHQHYHRPQCYYLTFSCPRWCWLGHCSSQSWRSYLSTQQATRRFQHNYLHYLLHNYLHCLLIIFFPPSGQLNDFKGKNSPRKGTYDMTLFHLKSK